MMRKKDKEPREQFYLVINADGLAFSGLKHGTPQWEMNWNEAKPLLLDNTTFLREYYPKTELLEI
jgi:hypothetical protein